MNFLQFSSIILFDYCDIRDVNMRYKIIILLAMLNVNKE